MRGSHRILLFAVLCRSEGGFRGDGGKGAVTTFSPTVG